MANYVFNILARVWSFSTENVRYYIITFLEMEMNRKLFHYLCWIHCIQKIKSSTIQPKPTQESKYFYPHIEGSIALMMQKFQRNWAHRLKKLSEILPKKKHYKKGMDSLHPLLLAKLVERRMPEKTDDFFWIMWSL